MNILPLQRENKRKRTDSKSGDSAELASKKAKSEYQQSFRDFLSDLNIGPNLQGHIQRLPVKAKIQLSAVNKGLYNNMQHDLYHNHAEILPYGTRVSADKKTDKVEADTMAEEVRKAVNLAYQMLIDYLKGHELDPSKYGISGKRWADFLNKLASYKSAVGNSMHPSTAAGYIVEDIATHILKKWAKGSLGWSGLAAH